MRKSILQLLGLIIMLSGSYVLKSHISEDLYIYGCTGTLMAYIGGVLMGMSIKY